MSLLYFIIKLLIAAFIIRFHVNAYRLGHNPIVERLNSLSDPLVLPFRNLIKHPRFDFAALLVALIIALFMGLVLTKHLSYGIKIGVFYFFLSTWLNILFYAIIIVVVGSWLQADPRQPVMQIVLSCSEWLMQPIRSILPTFGGLDFSPIVALLILSLARQFLG